MPTEYRRRSARVLLLDDTDRVLLLRLYRRRAQPERGTYWLTPGGGVDGGETLREAAARELHEEVGLVVEPEHLGPHIALTSGYADLGWAKGVFRDDFFLHRIDSHEVAPAGVEPYEQGLIAGHRWWPLTELSATTETVYPFGLVPLLRELLAGRIPEAPVELPWHH